MPQKFGVPKHPLFFLEGFIIKFMPGMYPVIFGDDSHLEHVRDDSELELEDDDAK
jgi:hypothetical protein